MSNLKMLENFVKESLFDIDDSNTELIREFIGSALTAAQKKIDDKQKDSSKQKVSVKQTASSRETPKATEAGTQGPAPTQSKMFKAIGTVSDKEEKDEDDKEEKKKKKIVDTSEKISILQQSDKNFKNTAIFSKKVIDDLARWVGKIPSDDQSQIRKGMNQVTNLVQSDIGKRYQKLNDMFKDAGEEQELMTKATLMGVLSKVIFDLQKQSK